MQDVVYDNLLYGKLLAILYDYALVTVSYTLTAEVIDR